MMKRKEEGAEQKVEHEGVVHQLFTAIKEMLLIYIQNFKYI